MQTLSPDLLSKLIVDHVSDGIVLTDAQGRIVWVNPAFEAMCGYSLSELVGQRPAAKLQGPDSRPESKAALREAIAQQRKCRVEIVNYTKSGKYYTSEINLSPIFDEDGTLTHFVAIQRDVTKERALLQESIDYKAFQKALELQAIVSVADPRGKITFVNKKFCDISGFSSEELIGQTHRVVNSGHHDRSFFQDMWRRIRQGETWHAEVCNRTKAGELYWVDTTVVPVHDGDGRVIRYVSTRYDITQRKHAEVYLKRQAQTDSLTGLGNRARFAADLEAVLEDSAASSGKLAGYLIMLDLDHFKDLNDSMGHHTGDLLLKEIALRLLEFVGRDGSVARLGGDEFAMIVSRDRVQDPQVFMAELLRRICEPVSLDGMVSMPSVSIGVAAYPQDALSVEGLMVNADVALYEAKREGRRTWRLFDPVVRMRRDYRSRVKGILEKAIKEDGFEIVLQPIQRTQSGLHAGFEVLARLPHEGEYVPPDEFIPIAEDYGLVPDIGKIIMTKALVAHRNMKQINLSPGTLAINVSAQQFRQAGFVEEVSDLLFEHGVGGDELVIEITETALIGRSTEVVAAALRAFREYGVRLALDDFGTGFSSLAHLRDFAVDKIKIDKSFVTDLEHDPDDQSLIRGLVELARNLGLEVVAEGVETAQQAKLIQDMGCHYIQGYYHARPLSVPAAEAFLRASQVNGLAGRQTG